MDLKIKNIIKLYIINMPELYPSKSFMRYNVLGKHIEIIGEFHSKDIDRNRKDVIYTWHYISNKLKNGWDVNLELNPDFKSNVNDVIDRVQSTNIADVLKYARKFSLLNNVYGVDLRRRKDFFGLFPDMNVQVHFFDKSDKLFDVNIWLLIQVMDNMMIFTNKYFYNTDNFKNLILKINSDLLDDLVKLHKKIDNHSRTLKDIIARDARNRPQGTIYTVKNTIPLLQKSNAEERNMSVIMDDYIYFSYLFSDILTLTEMIFRPNKNQILLIGDIHARNYVRYLSKYKL